MSKDGTRHWGRWAAGIVGVLVTLKAAAMVIAGIFSFAKSEVRARQGDVTFVLGVADRHKSRV